MLRSLGSWPRVAGAGAQRIDVGGRWPVAAVPLPVLTVAGGMVHIHTYLRVMLDDEEQVMLRYVITAPVWLAALPCRVGARDQRAVHNWVDLGSQIETDPPAQCAQTWARKSGTLIGRAQPMMTLLRAGWAGAAAGAPRFAPTIAPPDRMLVGRGSGVAG